MPPCAACWVTRSLSPRWFPGYRQSWPGRTTPCTWPRMRNWAWVGWDHVYMAYFLEVNGGAQIGGLVVSERARRRGAGTLLMRRAEDFARERGCAAVNLRSNVIRSGAHQFYAAIGYEIIKTQYAFRKVLGRLPDCPDNLRE